ncbi:MAG: exonuclease domain-containing protein [Sulfurimonas sp.]|uniref:exonuclease domain-containing protein n=1 Tax=Sulfurimonas sp. TaxID=2022749 RepID=UPI002638F479|nr:exonuclease domain-containing protein [Sulfurimonas sp.]MCW8896325.1 exonuclease domain-containing protein [Sulfurimonas sp.]MCW8953880.1 exonuclease domain-containing protein [Sulfurimonas sp.]MCW9068123.1 exonuclease domain-containing protein [Sulfurimonas sp.]
MLIFIDLETTGLESLDRICSIGIIAIDGEQIISKYDLVNEGKKISPKASSINHITNEMIKAKPKLQDCEAFKFLQENNNYDSTIIAHNVKFDLKMLLTCGFEWQGEIIDTLRVTKHLIPECEQFSLQFLRYDLKLYKNEKEEALKCGIEDDLIAHNALSDSLHVKLLYECLLEIKPHARLIELSSKNVLMQKFEFGKYSGRYIEEISMYDRAYLEWMLANIMDLDEDLRYSIEYNL